MSKKTCRRKNENITTGSMLEDVTSEVDGINSNSSQNNSESMERKKVDVGSKAGRVAKDEPHRGSSIFQVFVR